MRGPCRAPALLALLLAARAVWLAGYQLGQLDAMRAQLRAQSERLRTEIEVRRMLAPPPPAPRRWWR